MVATGLSHQAGTKRRDHGRYRQHRNDAEGDSPVVTDDKSQIPSPTPLIVSSTRARVESDRLADREPSAMKQRL